MDWQALLTEWAVYLILGVIAVVFLLVRPYLKKKSEEIDANIQKAIKEQQLVDAETLAKVYESAKEIARGLYWVVERKFEDMVNVSDEKKQELIDQLKADSDKFDALTVAQLDSIVEAIVAEVKTTEKELGLTTTTITTTTNDETTGNTIVATTKAVEEKEKAVTIETVTDVIDNIDSIIN